MPEAERNLLAGMYPDDVELQLEWVPGSAIRHGWRALMGAMDQRTRRYIEFEAEVRNWEDLQSARPKVKARRMAAAASTETADTGGGIGAMDDGELRTAETEVSRAEVSETESAESSSASSSDESIPMGEHMMQSRTRVLALIEAEKALKDVGSSAPPPPSPIIMEPSPVATDGYKFDPAALGTPLRDTAAPSTPVPPSPSAVSLAPLESFKFLDVPLLVPRTTVWSRWWWKRSGPQKLQDPRHRLELQFQQRRVCRRNSRSRLCPEGSSWGNSRCSFESQGSTSGGYTEGLVCGSNFLAFDGSRSASGCRVFACSSRASNRDSGGRAYIRDRYIIRSGCPSASGRLGSNSRRKEVCASFPLPEEVKALKAVRNSSFCGIVSERADRMSCALEKHSVFQACLDLERSMSEAVEQTCCCVRLAWLGVCELEGPLKRSPKELRSSRQYPQRSEIPSSPRLTSPKERRSSKQYPQRSEIPSSVNLRNATNPNLLNMSHDRPLPARSALFCMPGEALDVFACLAIYVIASLLGGSFWLGFRFLKMCLKRFRGVGDYPQLVSRKYRLHHRRKGVRVRIKTRFCYVRVDVERTLVFSRHVVKPTWSSGFKASLKFSCKAMCLGLCLDRNLRSLLVCMAWCCAWSLCGCCLLRRKGDDEKGSRSTSEHSHLRVVRGLPLPGKGTQAEPLELDSDMPRSSEREERGEKESPLPKPQGAEPPKPVEVSDRIPLRSVALQVHRSRGHFPYDVNCEACTSSKGKVPARRLRRRLQREDQTIGMDFYYFGRLRVLLLAHCSSNYTTVIPAMNLDDPDLFYNIGRVIREMGLVNKMVTVRCDQESALMSLAEKLTTRTGDVAVSGVIVDVVPGYRPQSKGAIERQVETMKQGFWAVWLDLEREVARNSAPEDWNKKLPLGGMLWQACVLYSARCYNLWSFSHQDVTTPIDRLHEEIVHRTRTLPFGCLVYAKVGGSKAHQQKYRGKKTVKAVYLGPKEPRGGGVFAAPVGQTEIDIFPVCRALEGAKGEPVYDVGAIHALFTSQPLVLDPADPERPIMFEPPPDPVKSEDPDPGFENEDEEMVPDDPDPLNDIPSYVEPTDDEGEGGLGSPEMQPDDLEDMEIDWLTNHLLESLFKGPDILATSKEVADSFTLKFGGSKIKCQVPRNAVSLWVLFFPGVLTRTNHDRPCSPGPASSWLRCLSTC